jgi:hypothetical protein
MGRYDDEGFCGRDRTFDDEDDIEYIQIEEALAGTGTKETYISKQFPQMSHKSKSKVDPPLNDIDFCGGSDTETKKDKKRIVAPEIKKRAPKTEGIAPTNTVVQKIGENAKKVSAASTTSTSSSAPKVVKDEPPPTYDHTEDESE